MFEELRKYLDDIEKNEIESTREFLNKLNGARRRLSNALESAELEIKSMKDERKFVANLKPQIKKDATKLAKDSLFNAVLGALRTNKEFDTEIYRLPLYEAVENDDTYLVRINGTGFSSKISIDIMLDKTAGRLQMWGDAVKRVRSELGTTVPRKNSKNYKKKATSASMAWRRLYQSGAYTETVEMRLAVSPKPAPFWSILNFGTPPVGSMSSERGGFPTPKNQPTNFIKTAEDNANSAASGLFDTARQEFNETFKQLNVFLNDEYLRQQRLDSMVEKIRLDRSVVRKLERELNLDIKEIDRNKLEKAVDKVRKGLLTQGRVNIGSGRRKTLSVGVIKEFLVNYG